MTASRDGRHAASIEVAGARLVDSYHLMTRTLRLPQCVAALALLVCAAAPVRAAAQLHLAFVSPSFNTVAGQCTGPVTIQVQDTSGKVVIPSSNHPVDLA